MSKAIFEKVNDLKAKRRQLESDLANKRGRKGGLQASRRILEEHLKKINDEIEQVDYDLSEYSNAILVATAQIEFVKECLAEIEEEEKGATDASEPEPTA